MTENLLQKLEEKMMMLLSEVEDLRKEVQRANQETAALKLERENHAEKLKNLLSLIETVNPTDTIMTNIALPMQKPVLVQVDKI